MVYVAERSLRIRLPLSLPLLMMLHNRTLPSMSLGRKEFALASRKARPLLTKT